jgi:hypothetical protein
MSTKHRFRNQILTVAEGQVVRRELYPSVNKAKRHNRGNLTNGFATAKEVPPTSVSECVVEEMR